MNGPETRVGRNLSIWRSVPIFCDLDDEVLAAVDGRARARTWAAGETIFSRGDDGLFIMALLEGRVKLSILSSAGRELLIRIASAGDLVGEIACFDGGTRSAEASAAEPVRASILSRKDYREIAARFPALHEAVISYLGAILRDTNDRLEALALHNLHARLARFILFALRELHGTDSDPMPLLTLNLTQGDLGLLLGASRPKINRLLNEFREHGVLFPEGPTWRCDVNALKSIAEGQE